MQKDDSRPYSGPHVIIRRCEVDKLAELLHANPRVWNTSLRERVERAREAKAPKE